jgi:2'-5' RNA ligase
MEQIRSFIAIELPDGVKLSLARLQADLKAGNSAPVKWVDPYSVHLTLKFLGYVRESQLDAITSAMETAVRGTAPFHLELKELGTFPGGRRVRVVWVGLAGELEPLARIQQGLEKELSKLGFAKEERKFTPHLTLGRVREQASSEDQHRLGELIAGTAFSGGQRFRVDAISLMKSVLTPQGAQYTRMRSVLLK